MERTPLFIGLTQPATFGGLPMTYLVFLFLIVMGGFIATLSFAYLIISGIVGYTGLRALAKYDVRLLDVALVVLRKTPLQASQFKGKGVTYRA